MEKSFDVPFCVEIPLIHTTNRQLPSDFLKSIEIEYASNYLELVGANPTKENLEFVLSNLPLDDAYVSPIWTRGKIAILPGMAKNVNDAKNCLDTLYRTPTTLEEFEEDDHSEFDSGEASNGIMRKTFRKNPKIKIKNNGKNNESPPPNQNNKHILNPTSEHKKTALGLLTYDLLSQLNFESICSSKSLQNCLSPPSYSDHELLNPVFKFCSSILEYVPRIKYDRTDKLLQKIVEMLTSPQILQLFNHLVQFIYWNVIHPNIVDILSNQPIKLQNQCQLSASRRNSECDELKGEVDEEIMTIDEQQDFQRIALFEEEIQFNFSESTLRKAQEASFAINNDDETKDDMVESGQFPPPIGKSCLEESSSLFSTSNHVENWNELDPIDSYDFPLLIPNSGENESLFLHLAECHKIIQKKMGYSTFSLVTAQQALITSAHFVVDFLLTSVSCSPLPISHSLPQSFPWLVILPRKKTAYQEFQAQQLQQTIGRMGEHSTIPSPSDGLNAVHNTPVEQPSGLDDDYHPLFRNFDVVGSEELLRSLIIVRDIAHSLKNRNPQTQSKKLKVPAICYLKIEIRRQIHEAISDILDPSRYHSSSLVISSLLGKKKSLRQEALSLRSKLFVTSISSRVTFSDSEFHDLRRFLSQGEDQHQIDLGVKSRVGSAITSFRPSTSTTSSQPKAILARPKTSDPVEKVDQIPRPWSHIVSTLSHTGKEERTHDQSKQDITFDVQESIIQESILKGEREAEFASTSSLSSRPHSHTSHSNRPFSTLNDTLLSSSSQYLPTILPKNNSQLRTIENGDVSVKSNEITKILQKRRNINVNLQEKINQTRFLSLKENSSQRNTPLHSDSSPSSTPCNTREVDQNRSSDFRGQIIIQKNLEELNVIKRSGSLALNHKVDYKNLFSQSPNKSNEHLSAPLSIPSLVSNSQKNIPPLVRNNSTLANTAEQFQVRGESPTAPAQISFTSKARLMNLLVDKASSQYSDARLAQQSRAPNLSQRKGLLRLN